MYCLDCLLMVFLFFEAFCRYRKPCREIANMFHLHQTNNTNTVACDAFYTRCYLFWNISNICLKGLLEFNIFICHSSGTPCNDYNGYCDILNKCRDVDAEGPLSRLKNFLFNSQTFDNILDWMKQYWWACILIGLGLVLLMAGKARQSLALQ